jgi:hypothetical protein
MSLEHEKFREEFESYKKANDKKIRFLEAQQKAIYEGIVSLKNKFTSMVSPIDLKLKTHLKIHEFRYNFCKYLFLIVSGTIAFLTSLWSFFKEFFGK